MGERSGSYRLAAGLDRDPLNDGPQKARSRYTGGLACYNRNLVRVVARPVHEDLMR
jgi:hypothetical protein